MHEITGTTFATWLTVAILQNREYVIFRAH